MDHLEAIVEVTVGRGPDRVALPMLPGQTVPAGDVADGIMDGGDVAAGYATVFRLTDQANPAPEPA